MLVGPKEEQVWMARPLREALGREGWRALRPGLGGNGERSGTERSFTDKRASGVFHIISGSGSTAVTCEAIAQAPKTAPAMEG